MFDLSRVKQKKEFTSRSVEMRTTDNVTLSLFESTLFKTFEVNQVFFKSMMFGKKDLTRGLSLNNLLSREQTLEYRRNNFPVLIKNFVK